MGLSDGWKKSTFSHGNGGNCVEAKAVTNGAAVRDTQNRNLGYLVAPQGEWNALLATLKGKDS